MSIRKAVAVGIAGLALATTLTACGASMADSDTPVQDRTGYEISDYDMSTFSVTLPSGREVECVAVTYRGSALECFEVRK